MINTITIKLHEPIIPSDGWEQLEDDITALLLAAGCHATVESGLTGNTVTTSSLEEYNRAVAIMWPDET